MNQVDAIGLHIGDAAVRRLAAAGVLNTLRYMIADSPDLGMRS